MKKMLKNKKILIGLLIIFILLIFGGAILLFNNNDNKQKETDNNKTITTNYTAYIKINPVIKLEFTQTCTNTEKNANINTECNDPVVTKYELINKDAQTIYKDVNLVDITDQLWSVLNLINTTAKEHDIDVKTIEIYSDWNKIEQFIDNQNNTEYTWNYEININDKEELKDIENTFKEEKILLTVKFNTNGGNNINSIEIEKGAKVNQPTTPTKNGYKFVEWQLNNKKFDFNSTIEENITLTAKWEKINNNNNQNNTANNKQDNNPNNNISNNENNVPPVEEITYFDIPWDIINDGTYKSFAKEHGITINLVADIKYQCTGHFSPPENPKGYKKGDVVIAYGHMAKNYDVCLENIYLCNNEKGCYSCTGDECTEEEKATCHINGCNKYQTYFMFGACGQ